MRIPRLAAVASALLLLAACVDQDALTVPQDPAETQARRTGYILGDDGTAIRISYEVLDGRAIFEGDIDLGPADQVPATAEQLLGTPPSRRLRFNSVITSSKYRWYNPYGYGARVPYVIDSTFPDPQKIYDAMAHITANVPMIGFVPRTATDTVYVRFSRHSSTCSAPVGKHPFPTRVYLADWCQTGHTIHEIGHVLGFWHEQSRCDRDEYVQIRLEHIIDSKEDNFIKRCSHPDTPLPHQGSDYLDYDEGSIMHYHPLEFSSNGQPGIVSLRGRDYMMGQRNGLSAIDISTLKLIYPGKTRVCCRG